MTVEIKPTKTLRESVEQGARLLDEAKPGWEKTASKAMASGQFDMNQWDQCMVGTLELSFKHRKSNVLMIGMNGVRFDMDSDEAAYVGFVALSDHDENEVFELVGHGYDEYDALDYLWREQVAARITGATGD